jgi:hypothetical protein
MKPDPQRLALAHALALLAAAKHVLRSSDTAAAIVRTAERDLRELDKIGVLFPGDDAPAPEPPLELLEALGQWLAYKSERKERYGPVALAALYRQMAAMGPERAAAAVEHSAACRYQGLVEPRNGKISGRPGDTPPVGYPLTESEIELWPHLDRQERRMLLQNAAIEGERRLR